jgi:hypothetical protein
MDPPQPWKRPGNICFIYPETEHEGLPKGKVTEGIKGLIVQGSPKDRHRENGDSGAPHRLSMACMEVNRTGTVTV